MTATGAAPATRYAQLLERVNQLLTLGGAREPHTCRRKPALFGARHIDAFPPLFAPLGDCEAKASERQAQLPSEQRTVVPNAISRESART